MDWASRWDGMMGVEVQAWGHLGTASFAELGAGGKSPPVLDRGRDLLCTPSVTCEGMAKTLLPDITFFLSQEPPRPALGPGRPTAHVAPGLTLTPFVALEDPPPAQEPPARDRGP